MLLNILKWAGIVLGSLVGVLVMAVGFLLTRSNQILNKTYSPPEDSVFIPTDAEAIAKGEYLVTNVSVCVECHGEDFGGGVVVDDPALGRIVAPNLTKGPGGFGNELSDADFVRVIRYGVLPDGRSLLVMPAEDYTHLSDADLGAIIAYVRSLPPVDSTDLPPTELSTLARLLLGANQLDIMIAERIDDDMPRVPVAAEVSLEYGRYLANISGCTGCHGPGLSGGPILGAPPDWPQAANLTPGGPVGTWSEADFIQTIRTGVDPSGHQLVDEMPWRNYRNMSDEELKALWLFIQSVEPKEAGNR
ncbi:MAG: cytochrome c [Anaerolineaceae bacterium]|nr:cytochrome c [Anaerolineaceae bacterium]